MEHRLPPPAERQRWADPASCRVGPTPQLLVRAAQPALEPTRPRPPSTSLSPSGGSTPAFGAHMKTSLITIATLSLVAASSAAQEPDIPVPPLSRGQIEGGTASITIPIRPTGKYTFLSGFIPTTEQEKVRETLPFDWIEIQWTNPGSFMNRIPPKDFRIRVNCDGTASYITGSFGDDEFKTGKIGLREYGSCCLLLEQFGVGKPNCDLGRTVAVSHPVESILVVKPKSQDEMSFRNADSVGDYRFWIIESILKKIGQDIQWTPEEKRTEQIKD